MTYTVCQAADGSMVVRTVTGTLYAPVYRMDKNGKVVRGLRDRTFLLPCKWADVPHEVKQLLTVAC